MASGRYDFFINPDEIVPDKVIELSKKDKFKNNLYYSKYIILAVLAAVMIVGWIVYDIVSAENPDYTICMVDEENIPTEVFDLMETILLPYCEDVNDDGEVVLAFSQHNIGGESSMDQMASVVRMQGDFQVGTSVIYLLTDVKSFQTATSILTYIDDPFNSPEMDATDFENMFVPFEDLTVFNTLPDTEILVNGVSLTPQEILSHYDLTLRVITDSKLHNDKDFRAYYDDNLTLLEKIK